MHTFSETGTGVPAFLAKLWRLVEDPETNHLIYWNRDGRSFIIQNQAQFARELLPMNYKHNNMASFIRQLNMYGFHKITSIENGGLKFDRDEMEFSHPCFKRGYPYLLEHIKRKIATAKTIDDKSSLKPEAVSKVLNEVKAMRGRQDSLDSRFSAMKQENEALWREIAVLRQKHMKQQQIVNKLIQFLVTIVQPSSRNMTGVKRNFQLMINDVPQSSKMRKRSNSNSGPIIRELTEELLDEVAQNEDDDFDIMAASPHVMSPSGESRADASEHGDDIQRPRSTLSVGSTFSETSPTDEYLSPNPNATRASVTPDPNVESVIYHITELPDPAVYGEDSGLNANSTVQMTQKVRQSNRRGRKRKHTECEDATDNGSTSKTTQGNSDGISKKADNNVLNIKKEKDIDPLSFLVDESQIDHVEVDPVLMGALTSAAEQNNANINSGLGNSQRNNDKQIYINQNEFISNEMPTDLFEESPVVADISLENGVYNDNIDYLKGENSNGNKSNSAFTSSSSKNNGNNVQKSSQLNRDLSVAKYSNEDILRFNCPFDMTNCRREITMHLDTVQEDLDNLKDLLRGDGYTLDANTLMGNSMNGINMTNQATGDRITIHPNIVNNTMEKNPTYDRMNLLHPSITHEAMEKHPTIAERLALHPSLDSETLEKLFGDSDVLGPYGLPTEQNADNNRKRNELIAYQPTYYTEDLSDMLNLDSDSMQKPEYEKRNGTNSVLNTPMPERD